MKPILVICSLVGLVFAATPKTVDEIAVTNFKVGIAAKDLQVVDAPLKSIAVFSKSAENFEVDVTQRLIISFNINKKADNLKVVPQQVFLHLEHLSGEDVVLVIDPEANGGYVLDLAIRAAAKQFHNLSGKFKASLIVGGTNVKTPINWQFANLDLAVPTTPVIVPKSQQVIYDKLPAIEHQFRQPEKRPPQLISDVFTLLCLAPLVVLFGAWLKIGINFNSAPVSIWTVVFPVGLASIFGLYFVFWLQLNMFETLKFLTVLGFVTFVAGNRVLRSLAEQKKSKTA